MKSDWLEHVSERNEYQRKINLQRYDFTHVKNARLQVGLQITARGGVLQNGAPQP